MSVVIPADYGYVVMSLGVIGLVQLGLGGAVMGHRGYFKSKEFLEKPEVKDLQELHKKEFGTPINNNGYPDMGSGLYARLMPYGRWVKFNNAQRAHYNMVEISAPVLASLMGAGLYYPRFSAALGFTFAIGRVLYGLGYNTKKGADGRLIGVIIAEIATIGLFGAAIYAGAVNAGFVDLVKGFFAK